MDLFLLLVDQMTVCQNLQMEPNECFQVLINIIDQYQNAQPKMI